MPPVLLALHAMATRFELVLHGEDPPRLRAAGEEALAEIERLERVLSFYRNDSEITRINHSAADGPVRVSAEVFRLLSVCADVSARTEGAFDPTIGPLMRAWRFGNDHGTVPDPTALDGALQRVGMSRLVLDAAESTVRFEVPGMAIDLGAAGKGFAVDRAIGVLVEAGVTSALFHGGTSSVHAIGAPPGEDGWRVQWGAGQPARSVLLRDSALSVSASHGKSFQHDGDTYGHVLDPRTGRPVRAGNAALVTGPSSFLCDALSTALLVNGLEWVLALRKDWPGYKGFVV